MPDPCQKLACCLKVGGTKLNGTWPPPNAYRLIILAPDTLIEVTNPVSLLWAHFLGYGIAVPIQAAESSHTIVVLEINLYYVFGFLNHL